MTKELKRLSQDELNKLISSGEKDLSNLNLSDLEFKTSSCWGGTTGATLENFNFQNSNLTDSNFTECELVHVNFERATLIGAWFIQAVCKNVNFEGALLNQTYFSSTEFIDTDFKKVDVTEAWFRGGFFKNSDLSQAINLDKARINSPEKDLF